MNNDEIKQLDHRQQAREKISIWYGSADNFKHGLKEVIANSTDEIINNFDSGSVDVTLHSDMRTITVSDSGRGMRIDGETKGVPNYELLLRTLFAGTKYENDPSKNTTGTNGVGTTVLCYTSEFFKITSFHDGKAHEMIFENGGEITTPLYSVDCPPNHHGTIITFRLDESIYTETTYTSDEVEEIVKHFAVGSNKVTLAYNHNQVRKEYHYNDLLDYYKELVANQSTSPVVYAPNHAYEEEDGEITQIALALSTCAEPIQETYLNLTYLSEGGKINEGIVNGIKLFANKYCKDNKLFPKGVTGFATSDIEESVSFIATTLSSNVEFQNQTKLSTQKALYKKIAQKHTTQLMEIFKIEDEAGLKKFINHLLAVQKHNGVNQKAKLKLKKQLTEKVDGIGNRVEKLVDSDIHGAKAELFVCEGDSALGSIVLARDSDFQAAYPLRGKFLNCLKANYTTIFKNKVIIDFIKILGCGIETDRKNKDLESFDLSKLRYGKIIITTDADDDGYQIAALMITMIYRLMPSLLNNGYVYIARTPLYEIKLEDDSMVYYFSEQEKTQNMPKLKGKYTIARCKGLGELEAETMNETAMNPASRKLVRVSVPDAKKMADSLEVWMGPDVTDRKEFIANNLDKYVDLVD